MAVASWANAMIYELQAQFFQPGVEPPGAIDYL